MKFAGIGTSSLEEVRADVPEMATKTAAWLASISRRQPEIEMQMTSGNCVGMDAAFQAGFALAVSKGANIAQNHHIYMPFAGFGIPVNHSTGTYLMPNDTQLDWTGAKQLAIQHHAVWSKMLEAGRDMKVKAQPFLIRDVFQVLGHDLQSPVDFVLCATRFAEECKADCTAMTGGTAMAIAIADAYNIPVFNMNALNFGERFKEFLKGKGIKV
jgi:hypothetical protein